MDGGGVTSTRLGRVSFAKCRLCGSLRCPTVSRRWSRTGCARTRTLAERGTVFAVHGLLAGELVEPLAKLCDFGLAPLLQNLVSGTLGALACRFTSLGFNRT